MLGTNIRRIGVEHGPVEADGVLIAADGGQVFAKLELQAVVHLPAAAVRGILLHERRDGIGIDLLVARRGIRGGGGRLPMKDELAVGGTVEGSGEMMGDM